MLYIPSYINIYNSKHFTTTKHSINNLLIHLNATNNWYSVFYYENKHNV